MYILIVKFVSLQSQVDKNSISFCSFIWSHCEVAVMRVHIDNFDMSPSEIANLWAEQDKYIDLLESRLRETEN